VVVVHAAADERSAGGSGGVRAVGHAGVHGGVQPAGAGGGGCSDVVVGADGPGRGDHWFVGPGCGGVRGAGRVGG